MRRVAHVDMDAFFAAIEEQRHTELCGLPLVIGGRGDTTEPGAVSTACYAAREYGIRSAMPLRTAYPSIFGLFYPDCGDFIGFIANFHSRRLIQHAAYCFRDYADFPLEHVATLDSCWASAEPLPLLSQRRRHAG